MKNLYLKNIKKILSSPIPVIWGLVTILLVGALGWYFINLDLVIGNLGHSVAYTEVGLYILFTLLFGFFVAASVYKIRFFNEVDGKKLTLGGVGGFLGLLVAGCPACSITLASYVGLASIIGLLPYGGLELKIIAILILLYVIHLTLKKLETCSIQQQQNSVLNYFKSISMKKLFVGLVIALSVGVSVWAIMNPNTGNNSEKMLAYNNNGTQVVNSNETFKPSTAPSGACGNSAGGCGCGN